MEYKCKICAGSLTIDQKSRIAVCDYCGTKQTLPLFGDDSSKALYERGNQYLLHNEYDKAEGIFSQLLSVNPNDAEIYWDLLLCKYGVTYAKDPQTGRYIPTCNRTHTDSVLKDQNYLRALDLSVGDKAELYKRDAAIIENIQKGILEISRKEKPFDVFISYKETDSNGNRTKDSIEAQKLYEKLTELGYKVFFSRITLESKIGEEYEPYIYAALSSSKVMITVCSSAEYIQSAWVKNEWSRFLTLRRNDTSKTLIPAYFDMNESELPEEFALLAAQNMRAEDFEQELIRGIKKLIPTPIILKERRKKTRKMLLIAGVIAIVVGVPLALLVTLPARKQAENEKKYAEAQKLYEKGKYDEAEDIFEELGDYEDAAELAIKTSKQAKYEKAQALFKKEKYDEAKAIFDKIGDYQDAKDLAVKCSYQADFDAAMELYYDRKYAEATWALKKIGDYPEITENISVIEKKWRESVSTIATRFKYENGIGTKGAYYIDTNGAVETFPSDPGNANIDSTSSEQIDINNHGKVVSISTSDKYIYALYEDGYVCNSVDPDWENIIQISDMFNVTNVALRDDGRVVFGDTSAKGDNLDDDAWLKDLDAWKDIVKIDWQIERDFSITPMRSAVLLGLDSTGNVHYLTYSDGENSNRTMINKSMAQFLNSLSNIKDIQISRYCVMALDNEGNVNIFNNDDGSITESKNIKFAFSSFKKSVGIDKTTGFVLMKPKVFAVDTNNNLSDLDNEKNEILEGIVYLNKNFCVSKSGLIYEISDWQEDIADTNVKTEVKDIWLER